MGRCSLRLRRREKAAVIIGAVLGAGTIALTALPLRGRLLWRGCPRPQDYWCEGTALHGPTHPPDGCPPVDVLCAVRPSIPDPSPPDAGPVELRSQESSASTTDAEAPAPAECTPGSRRCAGMYPEVCTPAGRWRREGSCSKSSSCSNGHCVRSWPPPGFQRPDPG
jgi:hypothetical protein